VLGLARTEGIGVVMVAVGAGEALLVGPGGTRRIGGADDGRVDGADPLAPYDRRGIDDLRRLNGTTRCGDLVLLSTVDEFGQVHAFEHQVGSHGGLGGPQNEGILVHPISLPIDADLLGGDRELLGAAVIHTQMMRWRRAQGTIEDGGVRDAGQDPVVGAREHVDRPAGG
jgi:hypothetical protein